MVPQRGSPARVPPGAGRSLRWQGLDPLEPRLLLSSATPLPAPFTPLEPLGSLVYESKLNDTLSTTSEVDTFTVDLDAGQSLTALVTPFSGSLNATLTLRAPGASAVATANDRGAGQAELIQTFGPRTAGTYTIEVGATAGAGSYQLRLLLNAGLELEPITGKKNNASAPNRAEDLGALLADLGGGRQFGAIVGERERRAWDTYKVHLNTADVVQAAVVSTGVTPNHILVRRPTATASLVTALDHFSNNDHAVEFEAETTGWYYITISLGDDNRQYTLLFGRNVAIDLESDRLPETPVSDLTRRSAIGEVGLRDVSDVDLYAVSAVAGDQLVITTTTPGGGTGQFDNDLDPLLELTGPDGALLAMDDNGADGRNAAIPHTAATSGLYRIAVSATAGTAGEYGLTVSGQGGDPSVEIFPDDAGAALGDLSHTQTKVARISGTELDTFTIPVDAGQTISALVQPLGTGLDAHVTLRDPHSAVVATADETGAGENELIQAQGPTVAGTYRLEVGSNRRLGAYLVRVFLNAALERERTLPESNDALGAAQDLDESFIDLGGGASRSAVHGSIGVVLEENFEAGVLGPAWSTYRSDSHGRIEVRQARGSVSIVTGTADGSFALLMDRDTSGNDTLNEAVWSLDLTGINQPILS